LAKRYDGVPGNGRIRMSWRTVSSTPWRRAPVLLRRRPGVVASVTGACAVLAMSVAVVPMFLSSVGSEAVALQVQDRCPRDSGASRRFDATAAQVASRPPDPFSPLSDRLGPASWWVRREDVLLSGEGLTNGTLASILARSDILEHVDVIEAGAGPGIWISDRAARVTGLRVNGVATINGADTRVAGIYRDLAGTSVDDFWCSHADMLLLEGPDRAPPPPILIADPATFADLMEQTQTPLVEGAFEAPLRDGLTVTDAEQLIGDLACGGDRASLLEWCPAADQARPRDAIRGLPFDSAAAREPDTFVAGFFQTHLPFLADRSHSIQTSVGGGIWPVASLAGAAGLALVAAVAALWFDRRRRELNLLTVRGVSPMALGAKAVLELAVPLIAGSALGIGLAYAIVMWLGPSTVLEPAAVRTALLAGAATFAASCIMIVAVVSSRARPQRGARHWRIRFWMIPWELCLGAATLISRRHLAEWGVPVGRGGEVSRVDVLGLMFPVLFLVTTVAIFSRLVAISMRPLRVLSSRWPTSAYLAVRRISRYRVATVGLVAASAVASGVLAYSATLDASLSATLDAKAKTFVGSDVAIRLAPDALLPTALSARATEVDVHRYGWIESEGIRREVVVYAIDPATFERSAFWDSSFADMSLGIILDRLSSLPQNGRIPAVLVGADLLNGIADAGISSTRTVHFGIEQVALVNAFPGLKRGAPTIYIAASALASLDVDPTSTETWIRGDRGATLAALDTAGVGFIEDRSVAGAVDRAAFLTVSWTFGFMRSLGIAAGALVLGGIAVHLEARRRDRALSYAFIVRMGVSQRQHRAALFLELSASVAVGCWLGLVASVAGAQLAYEHIDPVPGFRPDPLLRPAMAAMAALACAAIAVTALGAILGQRRTSRDSPLEVLRAGV
jgi:putative ABC transport system permease protein